MTSITPDKKSQYFPTEFTNKIKTSCLQKDLQVKCIKVKNKQNTCSKISQKPSHKNRLFPCLLLMIIKKTGNNHQFPRKQTQRQNVADILYQSN